MNGKHNRVSALLILILIMVLPACRQSPDKPDGNAGRPGKEEIIRVGVFSGNGASATCVTETMEALKIDPAIAPRSISAAAMLGDSLKELDVLVFPGGSGSRQNNNLGSILGEMVKDFVMEKGNGVVGICAGAYLISDSRDYPCLRLISAGAVDIEHDKRGSAVAEVEFTRQGLKLFPEMREQKLGYIQYHDGPLLVPAGEGDNNPPVRHATLLSDIHCSPAAPAGVTPGKAFLVSQEVGGGRVFACAGHPESTRGMRWLVPRMVRWVARKEAVSYSPEVVRPQLGTGEIMHDDDREMDLFWKLFHDDPGVRISALERLVELRHRNGFRWAVGLLRDRAPSVRWRAAMVLAGAEYTAAMGDLETALEVERDEQCRATFRECLNRLKKMKGE